MARSLFGGTYVEVNVSPDAAVGGALKLAPDGALPLYVARNGALAVDFQVYNETTGNYDAATSVTVRDDSYVPEFFGPDGVSPLWARTQTNRWVKVMPQATDVGSALSTATNRQNHVGVQSVTTLDTTNAPAAGKVLGYNATSLKGEWQTAGTNGTSSVTPDQIIGASQIGIGLLTAGDAASAASTLGAFSPVAGLPVYQPFPFTLASTARPTTRTDVAIWWLGPVQPTNMLAQDRWNIVGA